MTQRRHQWQGKCLAGDSSRRVDTYEIKLVGQKETQMWQIHGIRWHSILPSWNAAELRGMFLSRLVQVMQVSDRLTSRFWPGGACRSKAMSRCVLRQTRVSFEFSCTVNGHAIACQALEVSLRMPPSGADRNLKGREQTGHSAQEMSR